MLVGWLVGVLVCVCILDRQANKREESCVCLMMMMMVDVYNTFCLFAGVCVCVPENIEMLKLNCITAFCVCVCVCNKKKKKKCPYEICVEIKLKLGEKGRILCGFTAHFH